MEITEVDGGSEGAKYVLPWKASCVESGKTSKAFTYTMASLS
jgi:hypothetical protein